MIGKTPRDTRPVRGWTDQLGKAVVPLALLTIFFAGFSSVTDPDVWFHLRAGKEILAHGFLRTDTFSYPSAGRPYIDLHWLFQVLIYCVHRAAGEPGLIWFSCLIVTATFTLVYRLTRRWVPGPLAAGLTAVGGVVASERFAPRPEILTFLFLALVVWLVRRHLEGSRRAWWILPLVMLLWTNSEGLFVLGFAVIAAHLTDAPRDRKLWQALGLSVLASLVNPYFVEGALHPFVLFTRINRSLPIYSATIGEFLNPFNGEPLHPSVILYPWYLALIGLALAVSLAAASGGASSGSGKSRGQGRWPRISELVLIAGFVYLSLSARRNVALLPLVATPILGRWLGRAGSGKSAAGAWARIRPRGQTGLRGAAAGAALFLLLAYDLGLATNRIYVHAQTDKRFGTSPSETGFPREAARYLLEHKVAGPIFSTFAAGSFLTWAYPEQPDFIDGRLEVHSADHYREYLQVLQGGPAWMAADHKYGFNAAVIQYMEARALTIERVRDPDWAPVSIDANAIVLLKRVPANQALIESDGLNAERLSRLFPSVSPEQIDAGFPLPPVKASGLLSVQRFPWASLHLGQLFLSFNRPAMAIPQFLEAVRIAPDRTSPRLLLATALNLVAQPQQALATLETARAAHGTRDERATTLVVEGDILTALDRGKEAVEAYNRYLEHPVAQVEVASVLASRGLARLKAGDPNGSADDEIESLRQQPANAQAYWYLGMAEEARGRKAEALRAYQGFKTLGGRAPGLEAALARLSGSG